MEGLSVSYHDDLAQVIDDVIAPNARQVDREGKFPHDGLDALGSAGILGLTVSAEHGGSGLGLAEAADAVQQVARVCGSTAMVMMMHYSAVAVLNAHGPSSLLSEIAAGRHLSTLAFSEAGSRSHFWVPMSSAREEGGSVVLDARKSWATSAGQADSYVWSSRPLAAEGPMTLWLVPSHTPGLTIPAPFEGLGLRGNSSSPITAEGVRIPREAILGADGAGLDIAFATALPFFLIINASASVGLMDAVIAQTTSHLTGTRLEHLGQTLAEQPAARSGLATMQITADSARTLVNDAIAALAAGREDAQLRLLEVKAAAAEAAIEVTDTAMTVCGGSAFRVDLGIERRFRDARAARVMSPTTEGLRDFVGRILCGLPLM
jgi:isovaleryl-CoA dehydrogenase